MKKFLFSLMMLVTMSTLLVLTSCDNESGPIDKTDEEDKNLVGSINGVKNLDKTVEYLITGPVIIEEGGTLNIPAGTVIKAKQGFENYILVLQGGKINIAGTASEPVTITADKKVKIERKVKTSDNSYQYVEELLRDKLDTKVKIKDKKIIINFTNVADLNRILEVLNVRD